MTTPPPPPRPKPVVVDPHRAWNVRDVFTSNA